jgi:hypothetical protein
MGQNIECNINPNAPRVRIAYGIGQFVRRKITALGAQTVLRAAQIHGVGAVGNGCFQFFPVTGRRQELDSRRSARIC